MGRENAQPYAKFMKDPSMVSNRLIPAAAHPRPRNDRPSSAMPPPVARRTRPRSAKEPARGAASAPPQPARANRPIWLWLIWPALVICPVHLRPPVPSLKQPIPKTPPVTGRFRASLHSASVRMPEYLPIPAPGGWRFWICITVLLWINSML